MTRESQEIFLPTKFSWLFNQKWYTQACQFFSHGVIIGKKFKIIIMSKNNYSGHRNDKKHVLQVIKDPALLVESEVNRIIHRMKDRTPGLDHFVVIRGQLDLKNLELLDANPFPELAMCHKCVYIKICSGKIRLFAKDQKGNFYQQVCPVEQGKIGAAICEHGLSIMNSGAHSPAWGEFSSLQSLASR